MWLLCHEVDFSKERERESLSFKPCYFQETANFPVRKIIDLEKEQKNDILSYNFEIN